MPVRSLTSAVLKWPDLNSVLSLAKTWAQKVGFENSEIRRILCFGSAACITTGPPADSTASSTVTRRWGVGSDLDILIEVISSETPFISRSLAYELPPLPVPVEILVYTTEELVCMRIEGRRFIREIDKHSLVLYEASTEG